MAERAHPEDSGFQEGSVYRENLFKRYAFANKYTTDKEVLDIPCGVGWGTSLIKAKNIIGIDISEDAVLYARRHYQGIVFKAGDMQDIPIPPDSVDVVICMEGFEHVNRETGVFFLSEVSRVLRFGGLLVMSCPILLSGETHSGNPYHLYEPTIEELYSSIMTVGFKILYSEIISGPDGHILYLAGNITKALGIDKK